MSEPLPNPPIADPLSRAGALTAVVFGVVLPGGIALRGLYYLQGRSFWIDETMLALNIVSRDWRALATPLALEQVAPLGFLWLERLAVVVAGASEYSLRFFPLVAGCALIALTWHAARKLTSWQGAAFAAGGVAVLPTLVDYSVSVKPYVVDAAVCVGLVLLTLHLLERREALAWRRLLVGGLLALLLSTSAVFVLPAVFAALALDRASRREWRALSAVAAVAAVCGVAALGLFRALYDDPATGAYMARFWSAAMLTAQTPFADRAAFGFWQLLAPFTFVAQSPRRAALLVVLLGVGVVALGRRRLPHAVLLSGPFGLVLLAWSLGRFPLSERLLLFSAPLLVLLLACGLWTLCRRLPPLAGTAAMLLAGGLIFFDGGRESLRLALSGPGRGDPRSVVRTAAARVEQGDAIYIYIRSLPLWLYYSTDWRTPDRQRVARLLDLAHRLGPNSGNRPPRGLAVAEEGLGLDFPLGRGREVIGVPAGVEDFAPPYPSAAQRPEAVPDSGWADDEARRIKEVAAPEALALTFYQQAIVRRALLDALSRLGGRIVEQHQPGGSVLFRLSFAPP